MKITQASLTYNDSNTPISTQFDDVYFSKQSGVQETDYVFINGNNLLERWQQHKHHLFCIAETGFGTGLNFFRTVQMFAAFRTSNPDHPLQTLHFISTEKFPLTRNDAENIFKYWSKHELFAQQIESSDLQLKQNIVHDSIQRYLAEYPEAVAGIHRRHFSVGGSSSHLCLDLHYGDASESFSQIRQPEEGCIDAWYLDGFSPSKNESMWQADLFTQMARLSKKGATFATFTAAGVVKRGLAQSGFTVNKRAGFGRKRDMLCGFAEPVSEPIVHAPYYARKPIDSASGNSKHIAVIGSGIAGAILAQKLCQRSHNVDLHWQQASFADGASGNPLGGFYPQINSQQNTATALQLHSFLYAQNYYNALAQTSPFAHDWCGALQLGFNHNTEQRLRKLQERDLLPHSIAEFVEPAQATALAGIDMPYSALHIPKGGWISPPSLVSACISNAKNTGNLTLFNHSRLVEFDSTNDQPRATFENTISGEISRKRYDAIVLAMGSGIIPYTQNTVPFRVTRGQVEQVRTIEALSSLNKLICHKGYLTPAVDGFHALGSSYVKNDFDTSVRRAETEQNFAMHLQSLAKANWHTALDDAQGQHENSARAALRCSSPDHLPVVGALPSEQQFSELSMLYKALPLSRYPCGSDQNNVFVLSALGSRGLTTAPLMAELLVSQLFSEPLPLPAELADALNPNRFIVRSLIRRQAWSDV